MTRIYLSGPMTGIPDFNAPAFNAQAARLRSLGYVVVNPAELNPDPMATWETCMRTDIKALMDCDSIALLPGFDASRGASLELHLARELRMRVVYAAEVVV